MKFKNLMNYVLVPAIIILAVAATYVQFFSDWLGCLPAYVSIMIFDLCLVGVAIWGEWLESDPPPKASGARGWKLDFDYFHFGFYHPNKREFDPERLQKAVAILSRGQIDAGSDQEMYYCEFWDGAGSLGFYFGQELEKLGLGAMIERFTDPEELVRKVNRILFTKRFPVSPLNTSMIQRRDKKRPKSDQAIVENAMNIVSDILREQNLVLAMTFWQCLTVLTPQEAEAMRLLEGKKG